MRRHAESAGVSGRARRRDRGSKRLVDDTRTFIPAIVPASLGSLPSGVAEVCRNSNDVVVDGVARMRLNSLLHPSKGPCGTLLRILRSRGGRVVAGCGVAAAGVSEAVHVEGR
jgi:hypothetical protein